MKPLGKKSSKTNHRRKCHSIMATIQYKTGVIPDTAAIIAVFNSSGIHRPTADASRITAMFARADLIVSAWAGDELVGISRSLTDFCYCCYLSDLAVSKAYQHKGIGKELVRRTQEAAGEQATLILVAAPAAAGYYPKIGMEKLENAFAIRRKR